MGTMMRLIKAFVLAVAVVAVLSEAADDDMPSFLRDMQDDVHRSEDAAAQARHEYSQVKALASKNANIVDLEEASIPHPFQEKDEPEDDAEEVGPTDIDDPESADALEAVDEDMSAFDPNDPTAPGKGVEPMDEDEKDPTMVEDKPAHKVRFEKVHAKKVHHHIKKAAKKVHHHHAKRAARKHHHHAAKPLAVKTPVDMMATASKMQAEAQAKAQYEKSMAKMKKMAMKFGEEAKVYEARSKNAGVEEKAAAKVEHTQVKTALAAFPWLATGLQAEHEDITKDAKPSKKNLDNNVSDLLSGFGLKHKEVPKLIKSVSAKHAKFKKSTDALKQMETDLEEENGRQATSMMRWQALKDGWKGPISPPDEGDVHAEAMAIEAQAEAKSGHKWNKDQKEMLIEATRAHDMDMKRIARAQKRLNVMSKLVTRDDRAAKKTLATEQAEGMVDENDVMQSKVSAVKAEATMALNQQKNAIPDRATASLMKSLAEIQQKAAIYEQAKEAEEEAEAQM